MPTFVVIKDRNNEKHAAEIYGECNSEAIVATARELADSTVIPDEDEDLLVGIVTATDAGAARLKRGSSDGTGADGGIVWHGWLRADGSYDQDAAS